MKAIKVMATINKQGQLILDNPLIKDKNNRVEVIVLFPETLEINEEDNTDVIADFRQAWHEAMTEQTISVTELWAGIKYE